MTKNKQNVDIAVLKEQVSEIKDNHLPHIMMRLDKIDNRTWWILGTIIIGFLSTLIILIWQI